MSALQHHPFTEKDLPAVASTLLTMDPSCRVFLFSAAMGSGKTTLIKEMCRQLGAVDQFSSPTYSIINEYLSPAGRIFHIDLYRLKNLEELLDIGFEDYISTGEYCFIEWPDLAEALISSVYVKITVLLENNNRYISAAIRNPHSS
jgi:tRNA threonylcarbamoyladenosine biosynthesis protein TsaE